MTVAIALACYNGEKYIRRQLETIAAQTRKPDRVIISDDCSTDSTLLIVKDFISTNSLNWCIIKNHENTGYIRNFQNALSHCREDIVFLCDQDDIWREDKLERMCELLEKNPKILALASSYTPVNENCVAITAGLMPVYRQALHMKEGSLTNIRAKLFYENVAQGCCCCYRQEIISGYLQIADRASLPHDWALNMLAFEKRGLYYIRLPLVKYRIHPSNTLGAKTSSASVNMRVETLEDYAEKLNAAGNLFEIINPATSDNPYREYARFTKLRAKISCAIPKIEDLSSLARFPGHMLAHCFPNLCKDVLTGLIKGKEDIRK